MRKLALQLLLSLVFISAAQALPQSLFDGALQVDVPPTLQALDAAGIEAMFSQSQSVPQHVFTTVDSATRISFNFASAPLAPNQLEETKDVLKQSLDAKMQLRWLANEMTSIGGSPWFRLDYEVDSGPEPRRDSILGTSLQGRLLFIAISTPQTDYELMKDDLTTVTESLSLGATAEPVEGQP